MTEKRVLIVDDEEQIRDLYALAFTKEGFSVQTAACAEEAIEMMNKKPFPVAFLDLNLPGMDGVELCRQIRKNWPMTICFAVTGYNSLFELADCLEAGFEDYFTKPAALKVLQAAAEQSFNKIERWKKR